MMILVTGGAGSGKSEYAERYIASLPESFQRYYIATMKCTDEESRNRVAKHRMQRKDGGYITVEQPVDIENVLDQMRQGQQFSDQVWGKTAGSDTGRISEKPACIDICRMYENQVCSDMGHKPGIQACKYIGYVPGIPVCKDMGHMPGIPVCKDIGHMPGIPVDCNPVDISKNMNIRVSDNREGEDRTTGVILLLECVSNLAANEMFDENGFAGRIQVTEKIISGIKKLQERVSVLVVVTNNIFEDGICYDACTEEYIQALGMINRRLAEQADRVVEVVCGIPVVIKDLMIPV